MNECNPLGPHAAIGGDVLNICWVKPWLLADPDVWNAKEGLIRMMRTRGTPIQTDDLIAFAAAMIKFLASADTEENRKLARAYEQILLALGWSAS